MLNRHAITKCIAALAQQPACASTSVRSVIGVHGLDSQARTSQGFEQDVMQKLKSSHHAISTVESATGGRVADLLTNVGGAAEVYWGSVVTYDGSLRSDWGVPVGFIQELGTVTEQVASKMAVAGLERMLSGYKREKACSDLKEPKVFMCLSTTGFAGSSPLQQDSGMCCLGLAMSNRTDPIVRKVHAGGDGLVKRKQHKDYFAQQSLKLIMENLP